MKFNTTSKKHGFTFAGEIDGTALDIFNALPDASREYVVEYGLRQSLNDSVASAKTAAEAEGMFNGRWDKIKAGKMSIREFGPRDPFETECRRIAEAAVTAALNAKGVKKPDNFKDLAAAYRTKYADSVEAEARRRVESVDVGDILDDLLADEQE